jgi:hypothetical protein
VVFRHKRQHKNINICSTFSSTEKTNSMKNPPSITFKATAVLAIVLMVFACTKESTPSLIDELAKSNWRKASILVSTDSVIDTIPVVDILTSKPDCAKDNIWKFNAVTNTFQLDEGPTKCNVLDPDIKDQGNH